MDQSFTKKKIITSLTKARAVQKLSDYWNLKTCLLKTKKDPNVLNNKVMQDKVLSTLGGHSKLADCSFWSKLNDEQKLSAIRCFSLQEFDDDQIVKMEKSKDKASVYIMLSGSATVQPFGSLEATLYSVGDVFGDLSLFDEAYDNLGDLASHSSLENAPPNLVTFKACTVLRMSLDNFRKMVLKPKEEEEDIEKESELIAGIPYHLLTDNDKFYIKVYKTAKKLMKPTVFSFMDSYHLIPRNGNGSNCQYYHHGPIGREKYFSELDPAEILVIISGSIRLELINENNPDKNSNKIACSRRGMKQLEIQTKSLPLVVLQSGSFVCLTKECFSVGKDIDIIEYPSNDKESKQGSNFLSQSMPLPPKTMKPLRKPALNKYTSKLSLDSMGYNKHSDSDSEVSSLASSKKGLNVLNPKKRGSKFKRGLTVLGDKKLTESMKDKKSPMITLKPLSLNKHPLPKGSKYHIKMVFETSSSYLSVPHSFFERIWRDEELLLPEIAREIKGQVNHAKDSLVNRIKDFEPWITGSMDFNAHDQFATEKPKSLISLRTEESELLYKDITQLSIGSFTNQHKIGPASIPSAALVSTLPMVNEKIVQHIYRPENRTKLERMLSTVNRSNKMPFFLTADGTSSFNTSAYNLETDENSAASNHTPGTLTRNDSKTTIDQVLPNMSNSHELEKAPAESTKGSEKGNDFFEDTSSEHSKQLISGIDNRSAEINETSNQIGENSVLSLNDIKGTDIESIVQKQHHDQQPALQTQTDDPPLFATIKPVKSNISEQLTNMAGQHSKRTIEIRRVASDVNFSENVNNSEGMKVEVDLESQYEEPI